MSTGSSAGNTAIIIASGPLWTAVLGSLSRVEHHAPRAWPAFSIAFLGTILVTTTGSRTEADARPAAVIGNLTIVASVVTLAWGTVLGRPLLQTFPATRLASLATLVSLPGHWMLAVPRLEALPRGDVRLLVGAILYPGVPSTGLAYSLWDKSVQHLGPARVALVHQPGADRRAGRGVGLPGRGLGDGPARGGHSLPRGLIA